MKVYVVLWHFNYGEGPSDVSGVFSNLDLAEEFVDSLNPNPGLDTVNIICKELDEQ